MRLITFLYSWVCYLAQRFIYGWWSRMWRYLRERGYKKLPNNRPWDEIKVLHFFKSCKWVKDPWYYIDVISTPAKFYETKTGDCDEFAVFAGYVMNDKVRYLLSVNWYNPDKGKTFKGHNILVYMKDKSWYHIGNAGWFGPYKNQFDLMRNLVEHIDPNGIPCAYSWRNTFTLKYVAGGRFRKTRKEALKRWATSKK